MNRRSWLWVLLGTWSVVAVASQDATIPGVEFPDPSPDGASVVYSSNVDGNTNLWIMDRDGRNARRLTTWTDGFSYEPDWSPLGDRIVFSSGHDADGYDLWSVHPDGTGFQRLTQTASNEHQPRWSPDGTQIAFVSDRNGKRQVFVMNADGTDAQPLIQADLGALQQNYPAWSPDGTRIVVTVCTGDCWLVVADVGAAGEPARITAPSGDTSHDMSPDWSDAGIIFSSNRGGDGRRAWRVDSDGSNLAPVGGAVAFSHFDTRWADGSTAILATQYGGDAGNAIGRHDLVTGQFDALQSHNTFVAEGCGNGILEPPETCDDGNLDSGDGCSTHCRVGNPPDCGNATPSMASLWPVNHKMREIRIDNVTDPDDDSFVIRIDAITQDEPVSGPNDGATAPDGSGIGTHVSELRAERAGDGNGRVYRIQFTAEDTQGDSCTGAVYVGVPHDQRGQTVPVDDGQNYDATIPESP